LATNFLRFLIDFFYIIRKVKQMSEQTWIRTSLKERGFKMKDVAAALNITPPRVTDILQGRRDVQADEIMPLANMLGLSSKSLLTSLAEGKRIIAGNDETGPLIPITGGLTGTGDLETIDTDTSIKGVAVPPDAETADGLYCFVMADDCMQQEIRKGSLVIAGDPRIHFFPMVPGAIFIIKTKQGGLTARQYFKSDTGEDWLIAKPESPKPQYESYHFSMLPTDLAPKQFISAEKGMGTAVHDIARIDDIVAVVMWVHQRYTPQQPA
jgi:transcriptional regulator with XRE-family HTH domain